MAERQVLIFYQRWLWKLENGNASVISLVKRNESHITGRTTLSALILCGARDGGTAHTALWLMVSVSSLEIHVEGGLVPWPQQVQ